jgi:hypothetical protein
VAAPLHEPYRGSGADRPTGVPLPPDPMPLLRSRTLLKRWHYVSFWSPELLLCAARVHVGPIVQEYWGLLDRPEKRFRQRTHYLRRRVALLPRKVTVEDGDVSVDLPFEPDDEFEVYRPEGRAYIWSRKQFCVRATAVIRLGARTLRPQGAVFVDVNAGYHPRHTRWRWSAGAGTDQRGRSVAWSAIVGLFDTAHNSERTIWIDGVPSEIGPVQFSGDLRSVSFGEGGEISFHQEADLRQRVGLLVIKSRYDHWFGSYEGSLPAGIELRHAVGVRERQDALW